VRVFGLFIFLSLSFVENGRLLVAARSVRGTKHQETLFRDVRGREPESTSLTVKVTEHLNFLCTVLSTGILYIHTVHVPVLYVQYIQYS
jgi:hypothetical protein